MQQFNYSKHKEDELLIDFLVTRFPYLSEVDWQEAIRTGTIKVNQTEVDNQYVLINRDVISYDRPRSSEPEIDRENEIVHIDDHIIVVNKNGNIPIAESGKYYRNTLINVLKEDNGFENLYAVHRLDKETSGLIVIARKKEIATLLGKQFSNQIPKKEYHAVLNGELKQEQILVEARIKKNIAIPGKVRIRQIISPTGKYSKTLFIKEKSNTDMTVVKVLLFTGRTHQIRCHAEFIGHPVLGDKLYGNSDRQFLKILKGEVEPEFPPFGIIKRQLLHASSLSFIHPVTEKEVVFRSDYRSVFKLYQPVLQGLI
jgi:23S rRNA pseudouridine1911/1915/1917 synthase